MVEAALGDRGAQSRALGVISLLGQLASRAHLTLHRAAFILSRSTSHVRLSSFWPRIDLERYVIVDHWISRGPRAEAVTIAEISFAVQMKLFTMSSTNTSEDHSLTSG